jgi:phosphoserine phosphatase
MQKVKLICFDLDDTLIRKFHSVMIPCIINNKKAEHDIIQQKEEDGLINYIAADYLRAELLEGLSVAKLKSDFMKHARPLKNIREIISTLKNNGIQCILITVGPVQVAKIVSEFWGFDGYYGTDYEVENGQFTGKITKYITSEDKLNCLIDYCNKANIELKQCTSIGDGSTDIPVFKACGRSIAINASEGVKTEATHWLDTDDLMDLLDLII